MSIRHFYEPEVSSSWVDGDCRKLGIYKKTGSVWTYVGGQGDEKTVSALVELPGVYAAFFNPDHQVIPTETVLHQNYPNPFNPSTTIVFEVPEPGYMSLIIYDVEGRRVRTLMRRESTGGVFQQQWNGQNDRGDQVSSGIYFYRLSTPSKALTKKMVLVR